MNIQIKNRYSGKVILKGEAKNIKELLAEKKGANLPGANLSGANLSGANLSENQKDDLLKALKINIK